MDRLTYIAMASAGEDRLMETSLANNLANASTVGFKADEVNFRSLYLEGGAKPTRVYSKAGANGVDLSEGSIKTTGQPLDVAMQGNAWMSVTTPKGEKGYIHSASLHINSNGVLVTQEGDIVNSNNGFSITIPAHEHVSIDKQGGVNVIQNGQLAVIDKLKIVSLPEGYVFKSQSGMIQVDPAQAGGVKLAEGMPVLSGAIEESNVSPIDTLVRMMNISRQYEANISEITSEKKNDASVNELLNVR